MKEAKDKNIEVKTFDDNFINSLFNYPNHDEINKILNTTLAKTEKSPLSEPSYKNKKCLEGTKSNKPSIKKILNEIKEEQRKDLGKYDKSNTKNKKRTTSKQKSTNIKHQKKQSKVR